jgi:SAM-dependent methyltransferase
VTRTERWTAQAEAWAAWADERREEDVLPRFYELLPEPPRRALDVGCGEGRIVRALRARGYETVGVDAAPRLIEFAHARDPSGDYRVAAAETLPFPDGSFGLVLAFNVLMNVDDPARAIAEAARVLAPSGCICLSIVHPLASAGRFVDGGFTIVDYLRERQHEERVGKLVFANLHAPLERWSRWLEQAGFLVESLRELPRAGLGGWDRLPMFLYIRAVKG